MKLVDKLQQYTQELEQEYFQIPEERKQLLEQLSAYISQKVRQQEPVQLNFICTHNSRRSHLAQLWALAAAAYYEVAGVHCFSGGTEATAFNIRSVEAMRAAGFLIEEKEAGNNPLYEVQYAAQTAPVLAWSKAFGDPANPTSGFCAILVCSDADENCPFVPGVEFRMSITYNDPKNFDDTPEEAHKYAERVRQIGREMLYVFSKV
ncbi:protein-tyrosine-phosphatase [Pontibacter qinzhouensis]|uniref:Protein-tyrosine-phosphatase n=1 Tax=Pontibacter qinzhouensis TaxID=2603253 RepID=A0A5C8J6E4_9BACT|nr:protein-tyrosine-phosphatase [Pontibacter qinzhouensis]TXK31569.1 protein-tyrosine-phosphatase [Pontibacter qinzhouensis]